MRYAPRLAAGTPAPAKRIMVKVATETVEGRHDFQRNASLADCQLPGCRSGADRSGRHEGIRHQCSRPTTRSKRGSACQTRRPASGIRKFMIASVEEAVMPEIPSGCGAARRLLGAVRCAARQQMAPEYLYEGAEGLLPAGHLCREGLLRDAGSSSIQTGTRRPSACPATATTSTMWPSTRGGSTIDPKAFRPVTDSPTRLRRRVEARGKHLYDNTEVCDPPAGRRRPVLSWVEA